MSALLAPPSFAQTSSIHGIVSDSLTGERIPYANVMLVGLNRGTAANAEGFFLIPNLNPGTYELSVSSVGYRKKVETLVVPADKSLEVNVRLVSQAIETEEVVISGTRKGRLAEIATSIHVMSPKEIKLTPVTAQEDLFYSLQMLPGFVSTSDVSSRFFVRGGAGDQNLVLLDGMKIYSPFHALGVFSVFDPDIIKSVEVYTGAFPAEFGGRLSSVVNIYSKEPRLDRYSARAHVNSLSSKFALQGPLTGGISWMANGRKSLFANTFKKIVRDDVPLSFYDVYMKGTAQPGGNTKIDVAFLSTFDQLQYANPLNPDYLWKGNAFSAS
ncbi:MAG TPA: TonB-dependent receptor, partial [Bacteroidota bacterium]|nr:TonB-dependent receptor [Bacteroidota bacterium]